MHRFYVEEQLKEGSLYTLSKEEAHHAIRVLRLAVNDAIELLDGRQLFSAKIVHLSKNEVKVQALDSMPSTAAQTKITLYQGFPKGDKLFHIVQKCTEIGVYRIVPVIMERSVKKNSNTEKILEKCNRMTIEACKQCGNNHIPPVEGIITLENAIQQMRLHDTLIVPWEGEEKLHLNAMIQQCKKGSDIGIVIGPEGGMDTTEIEQMKQINAATVTFGKRILRTETAGMCAIFAILSGLND